MLTVYRYFVSNDLVLKEEHLQEVGRRAFETFMNENEIPPFKRKERQRILRYYPSVSNYVWVTLIFKVRVYPPWFERKLAAIVKEYAKSHSIRKDGTP